MVNSLAPVAKAAETLHPMAVLPSRRKNKLRSHDCDFFQTPLLSFCSSSVFIPSPSLTAPLSPSRSQSTWTRYSCLASFRLLCLPVFIIFAPSQGSCKTQVSRFSSLQTCRGPQASPTSPASHRDTRLLTWSP